MRFNSVCACWAITSGFKRPMTSTRLKKSPCVSLTGSSASGNQISKSPGKRKLDGMTPTTVVFVVKLNSLADE